MCSDGIYEERPEKGGIKNKEERWKREKEKNS